MPVAASHAAPVCTRASPRANTILFRGMTSATAGWNGPNVATTISPWAPKSTYFAINEIAASGAINKFLEVNSR